MQITIVKEQRKSVTIVIGEDEQVIVKVPQYMSQRQIEKLIAEHQEWIEETVQKKKKQLAENDWYITGKQLYMGTYWPVKIKTVYGASPLLVFNKALGFVLTTDGSEKCARKLMEKYYRTHASEVITPIAREYAKLLNVHFEKITIRKQATRWGSCSSKGNLSFNMKILCAPVDAIQYVVLHEVVHLKHFNHSKAFWNEVERWMPNYKEQVNYFKQFGQNLII